MRVAFENETETLELTRSPGAEREAVGKTNGQSSPLGATVRADGVNFSVYSRNASSIELLFFEREDDAKPARVIDIDSVTNRTYHYWHVFVPEAQAGQIYAYRVHGAFDPAKGIRFDPEKLLLDPYGRGVVVPRNYTRGTARQKGDNAATAMKSVVVDPHTYDWEGDTPLANPSSRTVVYEMHVRGFTRHPSSGVAENRRGTYAGLIEKIPYLRDLGITAVELLPVFQFDPQDCPVGLVNYWGYAPVSFFAPHQAYSSEQDPLGPINEFRDMVKALHRAGIEVILDVVYNHTAEGGQDGPTLCFRGFDNGAYYMLERDLSVYANYSGCGNTLNANHPVVRRMIVDSLRYWVGEMHVDGFRFDLASILSRDSSGHTMATPPVLWDIESDPTLAGTKLIAEAWDAAGLYQVGSFIGDSWKEWNGRFRDDVRSFIRGEQGAVTRFADRILGSAEIYAHKQREMEQSVNFVTCHDGFTLADLVSYNSKHNEGNGEDNRDGTDENWSSNWGEEGTSNDPGRNELRERVKRSMLLTVFASLGTPMLLAGDESGRTQSGNNNPYCQDNEISWVDWARAQAPEFETLMDFVRKLIVIRREHPVFRARTFLHGDREIVSEIPDIDWFDERGLRLSPEDWQNSEGRALVLALAGEERQHAERAAVLMNASDRPLEFKLPGDSAWQLLVDSVDPEAMPHPVSGKTYLVLDRGAAILITTLKQRKRHAS